jgi:ketosteroid isomerase-like protein
MEKFANVRNFLIFSVFVFYTASCHQVPTKAEVTGEIIQTEESFQKMTTEKGIPEAFQWFADDQAVIKRENDTLIKGKEGIFNYYRQKNLKNTTVTWIPDFVDISECRTMAYTYGQYSWKVLDADGAVKEYKGVFHTIWKRQKDGSWKYVWD